MYGYPEELNVTLSEATARVLARLEVDALACDESLWESDPALACNMAFGKLQSLWSAQQAAGLYTGFPKCYTNLATNDSAVTKVR